jgi:hypothetical protein
MPSGEHLIYNRNKNRRVVFFQAANGSYSFVEEFFSIEPEEQCWIPVTKGRSIPICDSRETALREAWGRVDWLTDASLGSDNDWVANQ